MKTLREGKKKEDTVVTKKVRYILFCMRTLNVQLSYFVFIQKKKKVYYFET